MWKPIDRRAYPPISDYALIGNRGTSALVSRGGSIDWLCLPHLDSPSIFAAILDDARGGRWRIAPAGPAESRRRYLGHSPVLETEFRTDGGRLTLTDFLPIERRTREDESGMAAHTVIRVVRCSEGRVEVDVEWTPRPDYARSDVRLFREGEVVYARRDGEQVWLAGFPEGTLLDLEGASVRGRVPLEAGESFTLVSAWGESDPRVVAGHAADLLRVTTAWWQEWASTARIASDAAPWEDLLLRSGVVLKLLTQERTGAIAAAPTTSLPEEIGGVRNWDYRYCWVRDSSLIARALLDLGHHDDAVAFLEYLETSAQNHRDPARIQVLYGLRPESRLTEYTLGHLDGYRGSTPVRIGNGAAWQQQHDIYGELLDAALELHEIGVEIPDGQWSWLCSVAEHVCRVWRDPDCGIWEVRGPAQHFTHSKVMAWVALDRACRLGKARGHPADVLERWKREAEEIRAAVLEHGYDRERRSFRQSFENDTPDAANLRISIVGFLPGDDERVIGTIDETLRTLTEDGMVYRYKVEETQDGVGGSEGAFVICTCWLVQALALAGRREEGEEIMEAIVSHANDVGLLAEEVDPSSGKHLGNFPQAFSHVGLINAAHALCNAREAAAPTATPEGD